MATIDQVRTANQQILRTSISDAQATTVAQQIDADPNDANTIASYQQTLLLQARTSSIPALIIDQVFTGSINSAADVDYFTASYTAALNSPSNVQVSLAAAQDLAARGVITPAEVPARAFALQQLNAFQSLGADLAGTASTNANFLAQFGAFVQNTGENVSTQEDLQFIQAAYNAVFPGVTPAESVVSQYTAALAALRVQYGDDATTAGIENNADLKAKGALLGQIAGEAVVNNQTNALFLSAENTLNALATGVPFTPGPLGTITGPGTPGTGGTFQLTAGVDTADASGSFRNGGFFGGGTPTDFRFTAANETVFGTDTTIANVGLVPDSLNDASTADEDVFSLTVAAAAGVTQTLPSLNNIENIDVAFNGSAVTTLNLAAVTGAQDLDLSGANTAQLQIAAINATGITSVDASGLTSITNGINVDFSLAPGALARTVVGSGAVDNITGGNGDDTVNAGGGADVVIGGPGNDTLNGEAGADTVQGGTGNDTINGGAGADLVLDGEGGNDTILGGDGNDASIIDGSGTDTVRGEGGNDTLNLTADTTSDIIVFEATATANGNDTINGFTVGAVATGGDRLDFSAFLGAAASASPVVNAANVTAGFNASGFNVIRLDDVGGVDTAGELQTEIGTAAGQLVLNAGSNTVVLLNDGANTDIFYVTTDALGQATALTEVATLIGVQPQDVLGAEFV